ncbi:putative aspartyl protease [Quercus suber]|uniref:Aspartyl protease n=2 Tax=Quercus suber TaxID=58331 RepID=A0AAW0LG63_QUESU
MASMLLCFILCFSSLSVSSSEVVVLPLTHSLPKFNSTQLLFKSLSIHSSIRFQQHQQKKQNQDQNHNQSQQISIPLSEVSGYYLSITTGSNPSKSISLFMDTGSHIVWYPCSPYKCFRCKTPPKLLKPPKNASVSCSSPACPAAHLSRFPIPSDICAVAGCPIKRIVNSDCDSYSCPPFYLAYGDGSIIARLYKDSATVPTSSVPSLIPNFTFGCAHKAINEEVGVAGFGPGLLSLPSQLATVYPQVSKGFSYCLGDSTSNSSETPSSSALFLGLKDDSGNSSTEFAYTPILDNPSRPYYYMVGLEGISVGKKYIAAPELVKRVDKNGDGGTIVDSGSTMTILPKSLHDSLVAELDRFNNERAKVVEDNSAFERCYYFDGDIMNMNLPAVVLHFVGNGSSVTIPRGNYLVEIYPEKNDPIQRHSACLTFKNGGDKIGGTGAIFGYYMQLGIEVVYDLANKRIGFGKQPCKALSDKVK